MNVYLKIKELCAERNISIAELEKKCGLGTKTINKWGTSSPSIDKIERIADYFGVSVDFLMGREDHASEADINELLSDPARRALLKSTAGLKRSDIEFISRIIENLGE